METFTQNYFYAISPLNEIRDSIVIKTTTKETIYYIDTADKGVFVTPELAPTSLLMPSPEILRTNNVLIRKSAGYSALRQTRTLCLQVATCRC
jgi:hypothetical protein